MVGAFWINAVFLSFLHMITVDTYSKLHHTFKNFSVKNNVVIQTF